LAHLQTALLERKTQATKELVKAIGEKRNGESDTSSRKDRVEGYDYERSEKKCLPSKVILIL